MKPKTGGQQQSRTKLGYKSPGEIPMGKPGKALQMQWKKQGGKRGRRS